MPIRFKSFYWPNFGDVSILIKESVIEQFKDLKFKDPLILDNHSEVEIIIRLFISVQFLISVTLQFLRSRLLLIMSFYDSITITSFNINNTWI